MNEAFGQNLGMNLARIRKAKGLTQEDLAEMVGVNQSTIQRAESQSPTAKLSTYKACAEALGITLSDIFSDERAPVEMELLRSFRAISADQRAKVLAILDLVSAEAPAPASEIGQAEHR